MKTIFRPSAISIISALIANRAEMISKLQKYKISKINETKKSLVSISPSFYSLALSKHENKPKIFGSKLQRR